MSNASDSWTAPASSHTGNSTHPFTLSLSDYPARFQKITLKYDANDGTNAPASETKQVEKGQSATFTVSNQKPTRENYTFKGWSTDENAAIAEYIGGNNITISQDTTLYAVWANHEHKDENDDGYCDTDRECMHEKDQDGYCTVEGCTHPHEGDGACCPKKPDNKPDKPNPEPSATPVIEGLTGAEVVNVKCVTDGPGHEVKKYQLLTNSYEVGDVKGNAESGYTCDITVNPGEYVKAYNTDIGVNHTLAPVVQTGTIKLSWNGMDKKWELANPSGVPVEFTVECENQTPDKPNPPEPENTSKPFIELTGEEAVKVKCTTAGATHAEKSYGLKPDGYTIGEVKGDAESGYTCDITVNPGEYVKAYNTEIGVTHTLDPESQTGTITLKWQLNDGEDGTGKWTVGSGVPVVFKVVCETGVTDKVTVSFNSNGGTAVDPQTIEKGGKATRPDNPTMDGYTFVNWYLDGNVYDFNTPVTEDITLHAQWKKNDDNPGQNPYPDPSPKPNPGGHDHGGSTVVVPITVYMPPKTGDMPFWYSIAQFLGLVK
ncbi:MAG: InlB B-repeat-containing protein [Clostridiales bacterium]|nr:InlB B-repeat-containing protein [Clostridiales bacterium]